MQILLDTEIWTASYRAQSGRLFVCPDNKAAQLLPVSSPDGEVLLGVARPGVDAGSCAGSWPAAPFKCCAGLLPARVPLSGCAPPPATQLPAAPSAPCCRGRRARRSVSSCRSIACRSSGLMNPPASSSPSAASSACTLAAGAGPPTAGGAAGLSGGAVAHTALDAAGGWASAGAGSPPAAGPAWQLEPWCALCCCQRDCSAGGAAELAYAAPGSTTAGRASANNADAEPSASGCSQSDRGRDSLLAVPAAVRSGSRWHGAGAPGGKMCCLCGCATVSGGAVSAGNAPAASAHAASGCCAGAAASALAGPPRQPCGGLNDGAGHTREGDSAGSRGRRLMNRVTRSLPTSARLPLCCLPGWLRCVPASLHGSLLVALFEASLLLMLRLLPSAPPATLSAAASPRACCCCCCCCCCGGGGGSGAADGWCSGCGHCGIGGARRRSQRLLGMFSMMCASSGIVGSDGRRGMLPDPLPGCSSCGAGACRGASWSVLCWVASPARRLPMPARRASGAPAAACSAVAQLSAKPSALAGCAGGTVCLRRSSRPAPEGHGATSPYTLATSYREGHVLQG